MVLLYVKSDLSTDWVTNISAYTTFFRTNFNFSIFVFTLIPVSFLVFVVLVLFNYDVIYDSNMVKSIV